MKLQLQACIDYEYLISEAKIFILKMNLDSTGVCS